jgi:hypothetical protein
MLADVREEFAGSFDHQKKIEHTIRITDQGTFNTAFGHDRKGTAPQAMNLPEFYARFQDIPPAFKLVSRPGKELRT